MRTKAFTKRFFAFVNQNDTLFFGSAFLAGLWASIMLCFFPLETLLFCFFICFFAYQINIYNTKQSEKELKKIKAYFGGTFNLLHKAIGKLATSLSLASTEKFGFSDCRYMHADDVMIFTLKYLRMPDAEKLDTSSAEQYKNILNAELWNTNPHIFGDYFDFPLYVLKIYEDVSGALYFRVVPCIDEKTCLIIQEYDRQKREKATREREQIQRALSQFKL